MLFMVFSIRVGPSLLNQCFPKSTFVAKVAGLICQLLPLGLFYLVLAISGVSWASLEDSGWTYPRQASTGPMGLWTTYSAADVHWPTVLATMPAMPSLVLMSVMCTLMGALAITDAFPSGPDGDPAPMETLNFDTELVTVGASSMLLGLTGGNVNFHKFSVIQLRLDGGTHRIAVLMIALFAGGLFVSGVPIGQLIPKWFLAGLFVNTGMHFVKGTLFSYRSMPRFDWRGWKLPSSQGIIGPSCVLFAVFFSPAKAILFGLVLSITFFPLEQCCRLTRDQCRVGRPGREPFEAALLGDACASTGRRQDLAVVLTGAVVLWLHPAVGGSLGCHSCGRPCQVHHH
ncbi:unnamed protein product [Polarella glacialis]|uniref:Uncharacterized protein n=1 Tax=Polarella glacialis TaxID=89957 RepID=A0A813H6P7_POLGL|nr:unnamed protein product [Polarella glacialis]